MLVQCWLSVLVPVFEGFNCVSQGLAAVLSADLYLSKRPRQPPEKPTSNSGISWYFHISNCLQADLGKIGVPLQAKMISRSFSLVRQ